MLDNKWMRKIRPGVALVRAGIATFGQERVDLATVHQKARATMVLASDGRKAPLDRLSSKSSKSQWTGFGWLGSTALIDSSAPPAHGFVGLAPASLIWNPLQSAKADLRAISKAPLLSELRDCLCKP